MKNWQIPKINSNFANLCKLVLKSILCVYISILIDYVITVVNSNKSLLPFCYLDRFSERLCTRDR